MEGVCNLGKFQLRNYGLDICLPRSVPTDSCVAVNELLPVLKETKIPTKQDLKGVFDRYEAKQRPRAKTSLTISAYLTRFEAMDSWWLRIFRVIFPYIPASYKVDTALGYMAGAPVFNFLLDPDKSFP